MSIVALHKITLYGMDKDLHAMTADLQALGCVHIVPSCSLPVEHEPSPITPDKQAYQALRWLLDVKHKRRPVIDASQFNFNAIVDRVMDNRQQHRATEDRIAFLGQRIEELTPWGDFTLPPLDNLAGYRLWFYQLPHAQKPCFVALDLPWQQVHHDNRYTYIVVIAREEPAHSQLPLPRSHTGHVSLHNLQRQLVEAEIALEDLKEERKSLSRWAFLLSQNLAHAEDQVALHQVCGQVSKQDGIYLMQGWAAQHDLPRLDALAARHGLALLAETPELEDTPPTRLENPVSLSGGEDLVGFYQTPAYHTWDPSRTVFFSFALFFAMILADAGYALVLTAITGYFWKPLATTPTKRRLRVLALAVLGASVTYGVLAGSYFGWSPPVDSLLGMLNVLNLNDFDTMLRVSIVIGCLHLIFANLMMALQQRGAFPCNIVPFGWITVIIGGFLLWQGVNWMGGLLLGGGILAVFISQLRCQIRAGRLPAMLGGLIEVTNLTKLFGDILSYLRLFALGLASSSLAVTFNQLAGQVQDAMPGLGLLLAILILILGHTINLTLGVISGFVHGLRLNFIEFFNWSLSAEGYPFRPFAKKEMIQ